jgi:hypothetical protein
MNLRDLLPALLAASLVLVGCDKNETPAKAEPATTTAAETAPKETSEPAGDGAHAMLDEMDGRKPVPLTPMMAQHQKQNMREHLVAVQQIVHAAAAKDFPEIEKAATKIGSSPQMRQMCNHMGAGAPGFTEQALGFHEKADGIIAAAQKEDYDGVMNALDATLNTCTTCHAQYKQQVVTEAVWAEKTGMGAPSPGMHH